MYLQEVAAFQILICVHFGSVFCPNSSANPVMHSVKCTARRDNCIRLLKYRNINQCSTCKDINRYASYCLADYDKYSAHILLEKRFLLRSVYSSFSCQCCSVIISKCSLLECGSSPSFLLNRFYERQVLIARAWSFSASGMDILLRFWQLIKL